MYRIVLSIIFLSACILKMEAQQTDPAYVEKLEQLYSHSVPLIQPDELETLMQEEEEELLILDTRSPEEYGVSHIEGARFVEYSKFRKKDFEEEDRDQKVIVYCSVGYRSERIGEKLKKLGFEDVHNLYGGIFEWVNQGHEVVDTRGKPTDNVHAYNENWGQWLQKGQKIYR